MNILESALDYAQRGWGVFPIRPEDKKPATPNGFLDAVIVTDQVRLYFSRPGSRHNVGIRTGIESGIIVVDIDPRHDGDKSLAALEAEHGALPKTVRSITGGGGQHIYFKHPGGRVGNRAGVRHGIDVRGDGGYVVAAPSVHESGNLYSWTPGCAPGEVELADAPVWLLDLILRRAVAPDESTSAPRPMVRLVGQESQPVSEDDALLFRALKYIENVPGASEGTRNAEAFKLAGNLRALCDTNLHHLDDGVAFELLRRWNSTCTPPLDERELLNCLLNSGKNGTPPAPKPPQSNRPPRPSGPGVDPTSFQTARTQQATLGSPVSPLGGVKPRVWPDPQPIPIELPPVMAFDVAWLPESLAPWLIDIADRVQCAIDYLVVSAMVVMATLVGRKVAIRPKQKDDWTVVCNLWGLLIGRPGILKTPAVQEAIRPLKRLEIKEKLAFEAQVQAMLAAQFVHEAKQDEAKKKIRAAVKKGSEDVDDLAEELVEEPLQPPPRKRYLVNDATPEKVGILLNENPNGFLVFRDEMSGFLNGLEKEGHECARAFYLEAWNGTGRFTYDRVARGTLDIEAAIVSMLGCIQPGPLAYYLRQAITASGQDDGFIQRFQLAVWPDSGKKWINVDRWPNTKEKQRAYAALERLEQIDAEAVGATMDEDDGDSIPTLRFDAEAQACFNEWREHLEARIRSGDDHPVMEAHLSKYRSLLPSFALLLHLVEGRKGPIGIVELEKAISWCEYLESHARRIYSTAINPDVFAAKALARKIQDGSLTVRFRIRDVYRRCWTGLTTQDDVERAARFLVDLDWLMEVKEPTPGAPNVWFVINPKIVVTKPTPQGTDEAATGSDDDDKEVI